MAGKIRGGQVKSIGALKKSLKKSQGSGITRIPKDAPLTVRFLEEPDRWFEFFEHFDPATNKGYICTAGDCPGCAEELRSSKRLLANAVNVDESKVIAVAMPTSLVNILVKRYDKYHTLLDRNYELTREGAGLNTEYDAESEGRSKFNMDAYEVLDLNGILEAQIAQDGGADEDDDEDEEFLKPNTSATKRGGTTVRGRQRPKPEPEDDDDDDAEDDPPFKPDPPRTRRLAKPPGKSLAAPSGGRVARKPPSAKPLR